MRRVWIFEAILLFCFGIFVLAGVWRAPFHGDEATLIAMSVDYDRLVKQNKWHEILYDPANRVEYSEQTIRLTTGALFPFLVGLARDGAGIAASRLNGFWLWGYAPDQGEMMWRDNLAQARMPDPDLLILARLCSAMMGAASLVFFYRAAQVLLGRRVWAWCAVLLLATHGDFLLNVRRAMQEGAKFFFLALSLYAATKILVDLEQNKLRRRGYVGLGIASGLLLVTKQDAAPVLVVFYFWLAGLAFFTPAWRTFQITAWRYLLAATSLAAAIFIAGMPIWWGWWQSILFFGGLAFVLFQNFPNLSDTRVKKLVIGGAIGVVGLGLGLTNWDHALQPLAAMIQARQNTIESQQGYRVRYHLYSLDTFERRVQYLLKTVPGSAVMYFESPRFENTAMRNQIAEYEATWLAGRIRLLGLDMVIALLFLIGVWNSARNLTHPTTLTLMCLIVPALVVLLTNPLAFNRYYLILQIPYALLAARGVEQVWTWIERFLKNPMRPA